MMPDPQRQPCPYLPGCPSSFHTTRPSCPQQPEEAYVHRLRYAQCLWLEGKPGQALLQLNHALAIELKDDSSIYQQHPWPYLAKQWLVDNRLPDDFLGNPVRHYQHYATRIPEPAALRDLRQLRAWICFWIMRELLPSKTFPRDEEQIVKENILIPTFESSLNQLKDLNHQRELTFIRDHFTPDRASTPDG